MNKTAIIILSAVSLFGGFFVFYQNRSAEQKIPSNVEQTEQKTDVNQNWESKIDSQTSVTITVTPVGVSAQSKEWKFNVVMDTHSVELNQDLIKTAVIVDDKGKEYKPLNWDGGIGGHHRQGVLTFNQIIPAPKSIELKIFGIGNVVRSFLWQLK